MEFHLPCGLFHGFVHVFDVVYGAGPGHGRARKGRSFLDQGDGLLTNRNTERHLLVTTLFVSSTTPPCSSFSSPPTKIWHFCPASPTGVLSSRTPRPWILAKWFTELGTLVFPFDNLRGFFSHRLGTSGEAPFWCGYSPSPPFVGVRRYVPST